MDEFKRRMERTEKRINELKDKTIEISYSEQQRENRPIN